MVTVDACAGCALFIGPTDGAIFLRGCAGCRVVALGAQLRARDCDGCELSLHCPARLAVEACRGVALRPFGFPYAGLAAQMAAAGLRPLADRWWDVHDFTPPPPWAGPQWLTCRSSGRWPRRSRR
jgi:protein XRP2